MTNLSLNKKICMLGQFGVGKTSLSRRFVEGIYDDSYLSTIGVKVSQKLLKPISLSPGKFCQLNFLVWDIEGFESDSLQLKNYLVGAAGALIIADLTRRETIEIVPEIYQTFIRINPSAPAVLLGNKVDLLDKTAESVKLFEDTAAGIGQDMLLTSAKSGLHVDEGFEKLGSIIAE